MCGLAGFIFRADVLPNPGTVIKRMTDCLRRRGPNGEGYWLDASSGIALGHRRLSIVDLSPTGHQPMVSANGRFVITYNGEIYNHLSIREELNRRSSGAINWRGTSDTETLLAAVEHWGIEAALDRAVGMFAFGLWDIQERKLILARDRMGEKPLYYGWWRDAFLFASDLSALRAFPGFAPQINRSALGLYFPLNHVPAPWSIYEGIYKLEPGHFLTLNCQSGLRSGDLPKSTAYWSVDAVLAKPGFKGTSQDAVNELEFLLTRSIGEQMVADVPVGAFLSGGIDSSTIVSLMQRQSASKVRTFSIGFHEPSYNEAPEALMVAKHIGTEHTELMLSANDALSVIPTISTIWDEPFADPSAIPMALLASLARRDVTVSLSGDGGDELFCGYTRYATAQRIEGLPFKSVARRYLTSPLGKTLNGALCNPVGLMFGRRNLWRLQTLAQILLQPTGAERYFSKTYHPHHYLGLVPGLCVTSRDLIKNNSPRSIPFLTEIAALDVVTYLPDDVLVKVDRATMAASLESRAPLLDHRIVEFALTMNPSHKVRHNQTKWPLRSLLYKYVPQSLVDRPKKGFGVPIAGWLRGPLKDWAADLLTQSNVEKDGFLDNRKVLRFWNEHQSGTANWSYPLWHILMFLSWRAANA